MSVTLELNLSTSEWINKHALHFKESRAVAEAEGQSPQLSLSARAPQLSLRPERRLFSIHPAVQKAARNYSEYVSIMQH